MASSIERWRVALLMAAVCIACGDGEGFGEPCAECPDLEPVSGMSATRSHLACFRERGKDVGCVPTCVEGTCASGHECVMNEGRAVCAPYCDSQLCGANEQCSWSCGDCGEVVCGATVDCTNPGDVCSSYEDQCFEPSGSCVTDSDCPKLNAFLKAAPRCGRAELVRYGNIECVTGECRWSANTPKISVRGAKTIDVLRPQERTEYLSARELEFEWKPTGAPTVLLVVTSVSDDPRRLNEFAIWGMATSDGTVYHASWSDGISIRGGKWLQALSDAPTDRPLFLLVQSVREGKLLGLSQPIAFVIGVWPELGDRCSEGSTLPDSCHNPSRGPQICDSGACRRLCASDADCPSTTKCGPTRSKLGTMLRICE